MATISKHTIQHPGAALMGDIGHEERSEHDFRPFNLWTVQVCSFTFTFTAIEQVDACLAYYGQKQHSSSRIPIAEMGSADHWEVQRWYERLPMYLMEEPKRQKVIRALTTAKKKWQEDLARCSQVPKTKA